MVCSCGVAQEAWEAVRKAFDALPQRRRDLYEEQALASKDAAAAARRVRKTLQAQSTKPALSDLTAAQPMETCDKDPCGTPELAIVSAEGQGGGRELRIVHVNASAALCRPATLDGVVDLATCETQAAADQPVDPKVLENFYKGEAPFQGGQQKFRLARQAWAQKASALTGSRARRKVDYQDKGGCLQRMKD